MLPAIARYAITGLCLPGESVVDPMYGIRHHPGRGRHLGRHAIFVEYESRWAEPARANLTHAAYGAPSGGRVLQGDAGRLISLLDLGVVGRVALVLTSPPCGSSVHGKAKAEAGRGGWPGGTIVTAATRSTWPTPASPALLAAMGETLAGCAAVLRPGGLVVLSARPRRRRDLEQALGMVHQ